MHKITKGLKKKKKGKKKHKEEELFKPEELEAYRKQHVEEPDQEQASASGNEEWRKFIALTSGVDDILKKTQGDLDRIKSTSFFQRIPPPRPESPPEAKSQEVEAAEAKPEPPIQPGIVQVSESESEEGDEEDDIFDTAYIDVIAAGEVKLAYIPESPTLEEQGDDPFDTSIAEKAIIGPVSERKGKKLVPIGPAVEVLTGRVQLKTCAVGRPNRRQVLKERDLLLGSFDDSSNNNIPSGDVHVQKTLLDEDAPVELSEEPVDLSKNLAPLQEIKVEEKPAEDDDDFALLAAESLTKTTPVVAATPEPLLEAPSEENWAAFAAEENQHVEEVPEDPFDTTFAENLVPGRAELKLIENEILNNDDFDFDPRAEVKPSEIINNKVSIKITDPSGQRESVSSLDRVSESDLNLIKPQHRDLLGGSNTDLSNLSEQPLKPADQIDDDYIEYCDPFDTSIVESAKVPGHTELKFLEQELLADIKKSQSSDDEFDPRAGEQPTRSLSRPDVLNLTNVKSVSFDLQSPEAEESSKVFKPLTPYIRKDSVPQAVLEEDPFDTSFVSELGPGKVELKLIENELFDPATEHNLSLYDQNFDCRDETQAKLEQVVQNIKDIASKPAVVEPAEPVDLLAVGAEDDPVKVLTPGTLDNVEELSYRDPFDTSIAEVQPGRTELKILETELIHSSPEKFVDLLNNADEDIVIRNPLNPTISEDLANDQDIDPFDTSFASNILPGRAELKLLESELM